MPLTLRCSQPQPFKEEAYGIAYLFALHNKTASLAFEENFVRQEHCSVIAFITVPTRLARHCIAFFVCPFV